MTNKNSYLVPFILVTSLFFLWAFLHNINPILIPHLKKACTLTDTESTFIDSSVYLGYFLIALPAGWFMHKYGYKKGIILGLFFYCIGAFLFISYLTFLDSLHKNLILYYLIVQYALPELIKSKGAIVNIISKIGDTGQGNTSAYAAANGGRNALTREWVMELEKYSIRVKAVVVAECYTPLHEALINTLSIPQEKIKEIISKISFEKRFTTAAEIANMVVILLSPVSSHTTGQLIYVDGGYVHLDRAMANA